MDKDEFVQSINRLYFKKLEQLKQIDSEFLLSLYRPSRNIGNETEAQQIRERYITIFREHTQHDFRALSRELADVSNNTQDNFMQQYNLMIARIIRFDDIIETHRHNLLSEHHQYYERHYPDAPVLSRKTAATSANISNSSSKPANEAVTTHQLANEAVHHTNNDENVNNFFRNIRIQVERENEALAMRMSSWIQSHYPLQQHDTAFLHCIRFTTVFDRKLKNDLAILRKSAKEAGTKNAIEEQLSLTLHFAREARANIFNTLQQGLDQLATFNFTNDQPAPTVLPNVQELRLPPRGDVVANLTATPLNPAVLSLMDELDISFSLDAYNVLLESMGHTQNI